MVYSLALLNLNLMVAHANSKGLFLASVMHNLFSYNKYNICTSLSMKFSMASSCLAKLLILCFYLCLTAWTSREEHLEL